MVLKYISLEKNTVKNMNLKTMHMHLKYQQKVSRIYFLKRTFGYKKLVKSLLKQKEI